MRLFVAVLPDEAVNAAVDGVVAGLDRDRWTPVARDRRHVTLRFHADADPDEVAAGLGERLAGLGDHRPSLRCTGAGIFGTALWLGVVPDDGAVWEGLLRAAGADPAEHVAHLTVARGRGPVPAELHHHDGPRWTPREVLLVASGSPYRVIDRFGPAPPPGADEAVGGHR